MKAAKNLQFSIKTILQRQRQGSYATQAARQQILLGFATDVIGLGYQLNHAQGLKPKHITAVIKSWQAQKLAVSTIKNRLAVIRHLCKIINKAAIVPSNQELAIGKRQYRPTFNRAIFHPNFSAILSPHIRVSLELQRTFGLRREESLKIKPHLADKGHCLELSPSWCKGGRGRFIPIRTDEQRYWLEQAKVVAGKYGASLIPPNKTYIQQCYVYQKQVNKAGFYNLHGLRHAYAQLRYEELTGWPAPINGGPTAKMLTSEQKQSDQRARILLTEELGHSRISITVNYCGK